METTVVPLPNSRLMTGWVGVAALSAALVLAGLALPAQAAVIFQETWGNENVGDDASNLTGWALQAGTASAVTVQTNGDDQELHFAVNGNTNSTVRTQETFDLGGESAFSIAATIRDLTGKSGVVGVIAQQGSSSYRFDIHTGTGVFRLFRGGTELASITMNDLLTALGVDSLSLAEEHLYEFQVNSGATQTDLALYIDGKLGLSYSDTSASRFSYSEVQIRLIGWNGSDVAYDDITLATIPEPAAMVLMGLGGLMMIVGRRRG